ncbi:hypothetical protein MASR2M78_18180 [Treponema sp.]
MKSEFELHLAEDGEAALALVKTEKPFDLIVSDIMMPHMDGLRFFQIVKHQYSERTPFLFLTARADQEEKIAALSKGAADYIEKPFHVNELVAKMESILNLKKQVRIDTIENLKSKLNHFLEELGETDADARSRTDQTLGSLSSRELEIAQLVARGYADKEIALTLGLSIRTVSNTLSHVYKKTKASNRAELVALLG